VMSTPDFAPGPESEEVGLFDWDAIPWDNLAFPSVVWSLEHYRDLKGQDVFSARSNSAEQAHTQRLR
ncbi:MAG: hypothetical protein OQJ76_07335, partial [Rhodospirillales bacterium]|nr:hypothetical protein [Rhodospirillales bacterium]